MEDEDQVDYSLDLLSPSFLKMSNVVDEIQCNTWMILAMACGAKVKCAEYQGD